MLSANPPLAVRGIIQSIREAESDEKKSRLEELVRIFPDLPMQGFELEMLGKLLKEVPEAQAVSKKIIRVAVLSSTTSEPLANAIRVAAFRENIFADVYEAPYGTLHQEVFFKKSQLYSFKPDLILLAPDQCQIKSIPDCPLNAEDSESALESSIKEFQDLWTKLQENLNVPVLQHTLVTPEAMLMGTAERRLRWSPQRFIGSLNERLLEAAPSFVQWVDVDQLSSIVGKRQWHDPRMMYYGKFGFSNKCLPQYTDLLTVSIRNLFGTPLKALILDLDNTLWGGVIGDDGIEGIKLGPNSAEGEAHQDFCKYVKALGHRGVILGICSKNDIGNVEEVFKNHSHMPLKLEDFAAISCNWEDKAGNLRRLAQELNIDLSAFVFVDDNPAECELIRQALPTVRVLNVKGDPANYVRQLDAARFFDAQVLSKEDLGRSDSYRARARSKAMEQEAPDFESYLTSLEMKGKIESANESHLSRLAQMESKTNQFNLSTNRLSHGQIEAKIKSPSHIVLVISLSDKFTDHGIVGYLAAEQVGTCLRITDWLMSCRVFSRTLEEYTFLHLIKHAKEKKIGNISLIYRPTPKNTVMIRSFEAIGLSRDTDGNESWSFKVNGSAEPRTFIK